MRSILSIHHRLNGRQQHAATCDIYGIHYTYILKIPILFPFLFTANQCTVLYVLQLATVQYITSGCPSGWELKMFIATILYKVYKYLANNPTYCSYCFIFLVQWFYCCYYQHSTTITGTLYYSYSCLSGLRI